jgi:hypothetical protein
MKFAFIAHKNQLLQQVENIPWCGEYSFCSIEKPLSIVSEETTKEKCDKCRKSINCVRHTKQEMKFLHSQLWPTKFIND